jgi:hypothetical protein
MGICELQRTKRRHPAHAVRGHIFGDLLSRIVVQLAPGRRRLWQELPVTRPFISGAKRDRTADLLRAKHQARRLTGRRVRTDARDAKLLYRSLVETSPDDLTDLSVSIRRSKPATSTPTEPSVAPLPVRYRTTASSADSMTSAAGASGDEAPGQFTNLRPVGAVLVMYICA